ncbi:uncharacterized protein LOC116106113 [Pistacia vera]|uniref:uncharacterized protein LOC116106113 n=1 Tax=Pistacia vera TaxID=55513 RepID=UPI001262EC2D|nr:uncharacterized protein LOC116106113 [Pistacia vera]
MTAPNIQRELTSVCAHLTTKKIIAEIVRDKQPFSLLVDESYDVAVKEQMAIVFRYVDKIGCVIERFIRIVHVKNTSAKSLKIAIDAFFVKHGLSLTSLRGKGYNGASNMRVLDNIQEELNNRFDEVNMRLLQSLVSPVATATVENVFSAMNLVKNSLRNRMGDDWMNNCLVVYIEKEVFATIENEDIIEHFQNISKRKIVLN